MRDRERRKTTSNMLVKKEKRKMQKTKSKSLTTLIITILVFSMVLAATPMAPIANAITSVTCVPAKGPVGTEVEVTVSGTTPGGLVRLYWDTVANLLAEGYAEGTTATFTIVVPAAVQGGHYVIAKDVESGATDYGPFKVESVIELIPKKVLPGDTVTVKGTGFAGLSSVVVLYMPSTAVSVPNEFVGVGDGFRKAFYLKNKPVTKISASPSITKYTGAEQVSTESVTLSGSGKGPYTGALVSAPVPGSITLKVTAKWGDVQEEVVMTDANGDGELESTSTKFDIGTIDYDTRDVSFTFATAPDAGSEPTTATASYYKYTSSQSIPSTDYTIDYVAGVITFATAPASGVAITAEYDYYSASLQVSASTNNVGNFTASLRVPTTEVSGPKKIIALDSKGNEATKSLDVVSTLIKLSPEEGYVGTTVTVTGRGFTAGKTVDIRWYMSTTPTPPYITVVDNYPVAADGTFTATFKVPTVPDPTAPGDDYAVKAIDSGGKSDWTTFKVVAPAKITLSPTSGKAGDTVAITGSWFTENTKVTFTFNGAPLTTIPSPVYTDGSGGFTADFKVPDVAAGTYTVKATDAKGVSATATFKVTVPVIVIQTRASEYMPGDTLSIYGNCSEPYDAWIEITDPNGVPFCSFAVDDETSWTDVDGCYVLPYWTSFPLGMMTIPSDAPLGYWNFTAYEATVATHPGGGFDVSTDKSKILDTNLFKVIAKPSLQMVLGRLDELKAEITGLVTTSKGDVLAVISTAKGEVLANLKDLGASIKSVGDNVVEIRTSVGSISGKVTSIDGNVATIKTDLGTVKADVGTIKGEFPIAIDMTPVWIAVVFSLVAALAAVYAVITISRKIAG
jgi:hypothetical protein